MAMKPRPIELKFHVTAEEREMIEKKMAQVGTGCMAAYLRKMALDGYIVKLDLTELRETVTLMRRSSGNINQIAKRVNSTGRLYREDLHEIQSFQEKLWEMLNGILSSISDLG